MAGSEKTGYEHSTDHLLENAYYIITPSMGWDKGVSQRAWEHLDQNGRRIVAVAEAIGAIPLVLDYKEHDKVVAAISHLPHLVASSLVNLVREHDTEAGIMKQVAAGGFKDITRIASSSPEMWEAYISSLTRVLKAVKSHDSQTICRLFETSRDYRNSISDRAKGSVEPSYEFTVDVADEVGAISTISVILAAKGISIKNIGINNNRERGEGVLKIAFYDEAAMEAAWKQMEKYKYEMFRM